MSRYGTNVSQRTEQFRWELAGQRLEDAIRKMTSLNAAKAGLSDRGLLLVGKFADVTAFSAERVTDKSAYTEPFQYSEGVENVIVNGRIVLQKGVRTDARPGRSLRRSGD